MVCSANVHLMQEVLNIASDLGAGVQFKIMSASAFNGHLMLTQENIVELKSQQSKLEVESKRLQISNNLNVFFWSLEGKYLHQFPIEEIGCYAGYFYSRIKPYGSVWYCCSPAESFKIANLKKQNFSEIWTSNPYQD